MNNKAIYFHAFNLTGKITASGFQKLTSHFPTLKDAWNATKEEFLKLGFKEKTIESLLLKRNEINPEKEFEKLTQEGIEVITIKDKEYPLLLKEIFEPPALFYFRGNKEILKKTCIAVVGSRRITNYGKAVIPEIISGLVQKNLVIVSGLALGVDAEAHRQTLNVGGKTIGVLGSGIDEKSIYPVFNRTLGKNIIEKQGLILSEYPPGTLALPHHFPRRNRLISGLSKGVVVIEAAERSGALITARLALEQNREVFAIPGNIHQPYSFGSNRLIQMGAKLVLTADDVLEELNLVDLKEAKKELPLPASKEEALIFEVLSAEPLQIDQIAKKTNLAPAKVSATLSIMEINGKVKNLGGMSYIKI